MNMNRQLLATTGNYEYAAVLAPRPPSPLSPLASRQYHIVHSITGRGWPCGLWPQAPTPRPPAPAPARHPPPPPPPCCSAAAAAAAAAAALLSAVDCRLLPTRLAACAGLSTGWGLPAAAAGCRSNRAGQQTVLWCAAMFHVPRPTPPPLFFMAGGRRQAVALALVRPTPQPPATAHRVCVTCHMQFQNIYCGI
jgi:hypothetical protein